MSLFPEKLTLKLSCQLFTPIIALICVGPAIAAPINLEPFIINASLEAPVTTCCAMPAGWFQGGTAVGDAGNWNPSVFPNASLQALDGDQVGYINNYSGANSGLTNYWYLAQTLSSINMVEGDIYSLTYGVASRADITAPAAFRVQINGNTSVCATCFAITFGTTTGFTPGLWHMFNVQYTATAADAGTNPTIYLVNDGQIAGPGLAQVEFDAASPAPEPGTFVLCGSLLMAVAMMARRRSSRS